MAEEFLGADSELLSSFQPYNTVHRSYLEKATVPEAELPDGRATVKPCNSEELKAFVHVDRPRKVCA